MKAKANKAPSERPWSPHEVLGWAYAECCSLLDSGKDPRKVPVPEFIAAFERDFPRRKK